MFCEISDADHQRTSADRPTELHELKKPLTVPVKTEGSVSELVGQKHQLTSETERALKYNLEGLINLKEAMMESVQDVELQLQQITEQLYQEKMDSGNVEAELLEAQEELVKTLGDFAAAAMLAERLNNQVNKLSSCLCSTEKQKADMEVEMEELRHQLEEVTATLKTLQDQTNKTTAKLHGRVTEMLGSLKKAKQEIAHKAYKLHARENDIEMLWKQYENAQDMVEQLKRSNKDLEDELRQAEDKVQQIAELQLQAAGFEKQLQEARDQLVQKTSKNAELESMVRTLSEEMARIQQVSSSRIEQLQNTLTRREDNERLLTEQLRKAEEAANIQRNLFRQRSEEIRRTEREELQRTTATIESERHSRHIHVKDSMTSDYPETGMSSKSYAYGISTFCVVFAAFSSFSGF